MHGFLLTVFLSLLFSPSAVLEKAGERFDNQDWKGASEIINESLSQLRASSDKESLAECLSMLSAAYFRMGAYSAAMDVQRECYQIDLASGDAGNISSSLNTLAAICLVLENYDEAERLIMEAIGYEESLGESGALAIRYGMASDILLKLGRVDEAIDYAAKALEIDRAAGRTLKVAVRQSQLAAAYLHAGKLSESASLIDEAALVFEAEKDFHSLAVCRHQQGMVATRQGDLRKAATCLREGLTLSRQTGELLLQRNIARDLAFALKDTDPWSAVSCMENVCLLSDTLFHQEMARKMAEFTIQNDLVLKEQTIAFQRDAIETHRRQIVLLIVLAVLLLVMSLAVTRLMFIHKRDKKRLKEASDIKDKLLVLGVGGTPLSPKNSEDVSCLMKKLSEVDSSPLSILTGREREIALLCGKGIAAKEIAEHLNLSPRTGETHKNNIFRKLGINSTSELAALVNAVSV